MDETVWGCDFYLRIVAIFKIANCIYWRDINIVVHSLIIPFNNSSDIDVFG